MIKAIKRGFTLIELLAVIVIIGMILAIAVPIITGIINNTAKNAFMVDTKMVIKAINYQKLEDEDFDVTTINISNIKSILQIDASNYESVTVTSEDNVTHIVIVGKNKWDGLTSTGTFKNIQVVDSIDYNSDTTPPEITLIGDDIVSVSIGENYSDAGATAIDDVDGNLNSYLNVINNVNTAISGTYTVIYTVMDSAGNYADPVVRIVNVIDAAPVITITGDNPIIIELGSVYNDLGATAVDDIDGDISANIVVTSSVNPNLVGSYSVTYNVTDSSGNDASPALRTVIVQDTTPPADPVVTLVMSNPIPEIGTITINYPADAINKEYKNIGDTEWQTYNGEFTVNQNGTIYVRCSDNAGNWSNIVDYNVTTIVTISTYNDMINWPNYSTGGTFTRDDGYVSFSGSGHERPTVYRSIGNFIGGKITFTHSDHAKDTYSKDYQGHNIFRYRSSDISRGTYYNEDTYSDGFEIRMNGNSSYIYFYAYKNGAVEINQTLFSTIPYGFQDTNINFEIIFNANIVTIKKGTDTFDVDISSLNYSNFTVAEMGFAGYNPVITNSNINFRVWK